MNYRKLRIAWSVGWGVLAVLMCVLWVRSYHQQGRFIANIYQFGGYAEIYSREGRLAAHFYPSVVDANWWRLDETPIAAAKVRDSISWVFPSGEVRELTPSSVTRVPHSILILLFAVFGALSWLPWRFSLRTLLIATTLVAVVLGLIVAFSW